jgi:hypothetical protein
MTIRFAMARTARRFRNLPLRPTTANLSAANDNGVDTDYPSTLKTALRYFARHGLSAPDAAQRKAIQAMTGRDERSFRKGSKFAGHSTDGWLQTYRAKMPPRSRISVNYYCE